MQALESKYWQEGIDSKALAASFLRKLPYLLLMGVAGAVLGSGLYLLIAAMTSEGTVYQAETQYYIEFAEGRIDAKDYYNDFTWNTVMATDWILGNTMEILGYGYDRNEVEAMINADILSDVRYLTITVRASEEECAGAVSEATRLSLESLVSRIEEIKEIESIVQIKNNGVQQIREPLFTWRAALLGMACGVCAGAFWLAAVFCLGSRYYTKHGLSISLQIPVFGLLYGDRNEASGTQEKALWLALQHCMEKLSSERLIIMDAWGSGYARQCEKILNKLYAEEMTKVKLEVQDGGLLSKEDYARIRQADGVILVVPFAKPCREAVRERLMQLENQDCNVLGAILVETDRKWMRLYGVH